MRRETRREEDVIRALEINPEPERYLEPAEEWMIPETIEPFLVLKGERKDHEIYLEDQFNLDIKLGSARITKEGDRIVVRPEEPLACTIEDIVDPDERTHTVNVTCRPITKGKKR